MRAAMRSLFSSARWAGCIGATMFFAASALAGEAMTECPFVHPEKPEVLLDWGECIPDGEYPWSWAPDEKLDHGNNTVTDIDIYRRDTRYDPLRRARIKCHYMDRSTLRFPIPGALLRCGIRYYLPDLNNPKPGENMDPRILHVWAISDVEDESGSR